MNTGKILLSSAYFPPVHYMALVTRAGKVLIEREENYIKQTFRNRCCILSANGLLNLPVPVLDGSFHKRHVKDIKIDYSKRWQQVHLRSIFSAYRAAPFFEYYFEKVERIISRGYHFLLDLNMASLQAMVEILKTETVIEYTFKFETVKDSATDPRYYLTPKNSQALNKFIFREYIQVFSDTTGFVPGLSTLDLIFNTGPDAVNYLPDLFNNPSG